MASNIKMHRKKYFKKAQFNALKTDFISLDFSSYGHSINMPLIDINEFPGFVYIFAFLPRVYYLPIKFLFLGGWVVVVMQGRGAQGRERDELEEHDHVCIHLFNDDPLIQFPTSMSMHGKHGERN